MEKRQAHGWFLNFLIQLSNSITIYSYLVGYTDHFHKGLPKSMQYPFDINVYKTVYIKYRAENGSQAESAKQSVSLKLSPCSGVQSLYVI